MYVDDVPFDKRRQEAEHMLQKYPTKVPVIMESAREKEFSVCDKHKFMVPRSLPMSHMMSSIRRTQEVTSKQAIFLLINNTVPKMNSSIGEIYDENKADDLLLYIKYMKESTFG